MGRKTLLRAKTRRAIWQNWGYLLLPIIAWAWYFTNIGVGPLAALSGAALGYFLVQARVPCCATIRSGEYCRNNATGLLGGCHLRQHRWQNIKMLLRRQQWTQWASGLFRRTNGIAASLSALATAASTVIAAGALVVALANPS